MLDVLSIEGVYCVDGQCDTYTGKVSLNDVMSGSFSLTSQNNEKAVINLDMFTFNIDIAVNDKNGEAIKRELRDLEVIEKDDGSWCINKNIGNDEFQITIRPS